jgi:hypothetical protein
LKSEEPCCELIESDDLQDMPLKKQGKVFDEILVRLQNVRGPDRHGGLWANCPFCGKQHSFYLKPPKGYWKWKQKHHASKGVKS